MTYWGYVIGGPIHGERYSWTQKKAHYAQLSSKGLRVDDFCYKWVDCHMEPIGFWIPEDKELEDYTKGFEPTDPDAFQSFILHVVIPHFACEKEELMQD